MSLNRKLPVRELGLTTLPYSFKAATGHSPHIVRTLVHDALAEHGTYGADLARILCGQTSVEIAKHYEVYATRHSVRKAQDILVQIQQKALSAPVSHPTEGNRRYRQRIGYLHP